MDKSCAPNPTFYHNVGIHYTGCLEKHKQEVSIKYTEIIPKNMEVRSVLLLIISK